ncbi:MAG: sigma-54-dependent Fis family transcriptional regulator [bacterium]|nr:sigma-54-dependent Fis family transcriptional regulator [bacterium]
MPLKTKPRILLADDEADIRSSLRMILEYEGMESIEAATGPEALEKVASDEPDAVLLDIKMPRMDGLEVLAQLREKHPDVAVVMISGHGTIETALEATRLGALDFMEKPLERERVLLVLRNALERSRLERQVREFRSSAEERHRMVGDSAVLREIRDAVARIAPTRASVLITGESGTGKELVARAIHRNSTRSDKPFVSVNCAAIPEELIESELFGHVRGSFTGASKDQIGKFVRAEGGTIFLDEVGDMSLKTQAKVLRVLQDGSVEPVGAAKTLAVDVRVVAATNKDLPHEISAGAFREDLYFRLNVVPLHLPPLRERADDVEALVKHFAGTFCAENNYREKEFDAAAIRALARQPWRGNARELRNAVERLIIMAPESTVRASDLPAGLGLALATEGAAAADGVLPIAYHGATLQRFKERAERAYIVAMLRANDWNIAGTAKSIETPRSNLYKKLEAHDINREKDGAS